MKKLLLIGTVVTGVATGFSANAADSFKGFSANLSAGWSQMTYKHKGTSATFFKKGNGMNGKLQGVFSNVVNNAFYIAGDLGAGYDSAATKGSEAGDSAKVLRGFFITPGLRLGGIINGKTLIFARVGIDWSFSRLTLNEAGSSVRAGGTLTSIVPGVGVEYMVDDKWSLSLHGNYAIGFGDAKFKVTGATLKTDNKFNTLSINVGVGYKF